MSAPPELVALAERWERESEIALGNSKTQRRPEEAEACRTAHGYLLHCAGQLRDAIDAPRVIDERAARQAASRQLYPGGDS